jgi:exonuclease SbcC
MIERNEGDVLKKYEPGIIPSELSNIVYIQGPNSSGKSTLLNLIALAFYGHKLPSDDIDPTLREKILNLLDLNHQKITFDVTVDNPEMGLTLISCKPNANDKDISVKKVADGKEIRLSAETFLREFKLIYDIPHDPLERLPQLLSEVQIKQKDIGGQIDRLREYLRNMIQEIRSSRDPEELANLESKYKDYETEKSSIEKALKILRAHIKKLKEYRLTKAFIATYESLKNDQSRLEELNKEIEAANRNGRKKATEKSRILLRKEKALEDCTAKYLNVFELLPPLVSSADQPHLKLWKQSVLDDEIHHSEVYATLREETRYFITVISEKLEQERIRSQKDLVANELYKSLLQILSEQKFTEITIPGLNQTVEVFKSIIITELSKNKDVFEVMNQLQKCKESLESFLVALDNAIKVINEIKSIIDTDDNYQNIDELMNEKSILENRKRINENNLQALREALVKINLDPMKSWEVFEKISQEDEIRQYAEFSDEILKNKLRDISNTIREKEEQFNRIDGIMENLHRDIVIMESKHEHEYHQYLNNLDSFYSIILRLESRFLNQYDNYIDQVINLKSGMLGNLSDDEKKYIELVGKYLAKKMHVIRYIDREYEIVNINMLEKKILTTTNKEIFFADLGTGQSQAAFLTTKLAMDERRKIIALFDEVAMMDERSLKPVKDKIKDLYLQWKFFMAIIVQKGEEVKVESLI